MFLTELNKEEASAFLSLVTQFAKVDETFAKEEKRLINDYLDELNLKEKDIKDLSYEEIINVLKKSENRIKSIVYFELVGLALVDGEYGDKEIDFLDKIAVSLDIRRDKKIAFANYFFNFKEIYDFSVVEAESKIELLKEEAEALL
ncbi:TerB family tellurite resistance protein [Clostridium paraputrificum]|uniref:tellurite resistance TerB family protein n=1 Tax=Clostridium paraputrificum TaxID=29363 RepID=UPI0006664D92|nr:TerB family tellurite resistance protein [Clostridium paraputrificum]MDB2112200.1 TerB family tellurite resistance protein [Clostridium paraputrificum]